jgi:hypothetical protein
MADLIRVFPGVSLPAEAQVRRKRFHTVKRTFRAIAHHVAAAWLEAVRMDRRLSMTKTEHVVTNQRRDISEWF